MEQRSLFFGNMPFLRDILKKESRTITGYAIVFNMESNLLADWTESYKEIISPSAITRDDLNKWDIKMTMFHNREKLLARSENGKGTLSLHIDSFGVRYTFEAPRTDDGQTALELVRRGDISGASFMFSVDENDVSYSKTSDGTIIRTVNKIKNIYDLTLASDPAYEQTTADLREMPDKVKNLFKR